VPLTGELARHGLPPKGEGYSVPRQRVPGGYTMPRHGVPPQGGYSIPGIGTQYRYSITGQNTGGYSVPRHGVPRGTRCRGVRGAAYTGAAVCSPWGWKPNSVRNKIDRNDSSRLECFASVASRRGAAPAISKHINLHRKEAASSVHRTVHSDIRLASRQK